MPLNDPTSQPLKANAQGLPCTLVPGNLFFVERLDLPEGLSEEERDAFVLTALEGISPFTVEHLQWGWVHGGGSGRSALVYAASADRVASTMGQDMTQGLHVFPSFLPFIGLSLEAPGMVFGVSGGAASLLVYDRAGDMPVEIHSVEWVGGEEGPSPEGVKQDMLRALGIRGIPVEDGLWICSGFKSRNSGHLSFEVERGVAGGNLTDWDLEGHALWNADIRPMTRRRDLERASLWSKRLWNGLLGCAALVILFFVLEWVSVGLDSRVKASQTLVQERRDRVAGIESKLRNIEVFRQGAAASLQPLVMLDQINRLRPDDVYFTEVKARDGRVIEITGVADRNGVELLNRFRDELGTVSWLAGVTLDVTRIAQGTAQFSLVATFEDFAHEAEEEPLEEGV